MQHAVFRKILAVLFGLVLAATGLWASPAGEGGAGRGDGEGNGDGPRHRQDGDRAGVRRDINLSPGVDRVSNNVDPFAVGFEAGWLIDGVNEKLALGDWALDREEFDWTDNFVPTALLDRESGGELGDARPRLPTFFASVRAFTTLSDPDSEASRLVNGRELTADDVVYTYQRSTAQGDFTERSSA